MIILYNNFLKTNSNVAMKGKVEGKLICYLGVIVCKNFRLTKKLGTGAFGEIYLAVNKSNEE